MFPPKTGGLPGSTNGKRPGRLPVHARKGVAAAVHKAVMGKMNGPQTQPGQPVPTGGTGKRPID